MGVFRTDQQDVPPRTKVAITSLAQSLLLKKCHKLKC